MNDLNCGSLVEKDSDVPTVGELSEGAPGGTLIPTLATIPSGIRAMGKMLAHITVTETASTHCVKTHSGPRAFLSVHAWKNCTVMGLRDFCTGQLTSSSSDMQADDSDSLQLFLL